MRICQFLIAYGVLALAGCGSSDVSIELEWEDCLFDSSRVLAETGECAEVKVPVNWDDPDGGTIEVFVKRLGDGGGQQIWLLAGGPGSAGDGYEAMARLLFESDPSLNIYLLDHRGTGRSSRLGCPVQEAEDSDGSFDITSAEYPDCIASVEAEWGTKLAHFNTTMAAHDLGRLIDKTSRADQAIHVYGGSYGTYWLQRYLQLYPTQATSASMLGLVAPDFNFGGYNQQYEHVGGALLAACSQDTFCASKLGPNAKDTFATVMDNLDEYCPAVGLNRETLRSYFGTRLLQGWESRVVPLAIVYRIERCAPADVVALQRLADSLDAPSLVREDKLYSNVLHNHVALSEQWDESNPSLMEAQSLLDNGSWAFGSTRLTELNTIWPKYTEDSYGNRFAETSIPLLMLNGEFDPATPLEQAAAVGGHFSGANQHFVTIPGGTHSLKSPYSEGSHCARDMVFAFMKSPTEPLLDCMEDVVPLDFRNGPSTALGTQDLWEN